MSLPSKRAAMRAWLPWLEVLCVTLIALPLLFPTLDPKVTLAALILLAVCWIGQLCCAATTLPATPFNGALLLWSVALGVGIGVTAYPLETLPKATGLLLGLAIWRALTVWGATWRRLPWAIGGLVLLGGGFATLGMLSVRWGAKVPFLSALIARLPQRLLTLPGGPEAGVNANQLAGTVILHVPLLLALVFAYWGPHRGLRWLGRGFSLIALAFFAGLLILTQSRSGWMGGAAGLLTLGGLWGLTGGARWRRATLVLTGLIIAGVIIFLTQSPPAIFSSLWDTPGGVDTAVGTLSLAGRVEIWSRALYAIQDFPFTGCGLGTFREVVWVLYPLFTIAPDNDFAHAHNIFLQTAVDTGITGLIAYLALLLIAGYVGWRIARRDARLRPVALGLVAGLVALHVYGLTDALAPGSKPGLIFWYALGLLSLMEQLTCPLQAADGG